MVFRVLVFLSFCVPVFRLPVFTVAEFRVPAIPVSVYPVIRRSLYRESAKVKRARESAVGFSRPRTLALATLSRSPDQTKSLIAG